jgi:glycosyltransferase involved in cell wall biosynthesis
MRIVLTKREALDVPDGINIFMFSMADALAEMGHTVTMVATASTNTAKIEEYFAPQHHFDVISLGNHKNVDYKRTLLTWVRRSRKVIGALRPDVVIINGAVPVKLPGLNMTVSHDAERKFSSYPFVRDAFKRWAYRRSDAIVATCEEVRSALWEDTGISRDRIHVIPTCVRLSTYRNRPLAERENAVLHMGTIDYKNPLASMKAFARIASGDRKLYVTGKITDEMRTFMTGVDGEVRRRIELLGFVPVQRLLDLLGGVKVVSVPSVYYAAVASPTVIEALASGTPVVGSSSISTQVLTDGYNGFVRDHADDREIAAGYETLLGDEATWARISSNAVESAQQFSARRVADMYVNLAEDRIAQRSARSRAVAEASA